MRVFIATIFLIVITASAHASRDVNWRVVTFNSKKDGASGTAILHSAQPYTAIDGKMVSNVMVVACFANNISVGIFFWRQHMIKAEQIANDNNTLPQLANNGQFMVQIDEQKPIAVPWLINDKNTAIGLWTSDQAIPFIETLFDKTSLRLQFTLAKAITHTQTFDIAGARDAIKPLAKACDWKL